jgi:hypothetical protein
MIPPRIAIVTACVRSLAPSFSMMCFTWIFTVSSEIPNRLATSWLRLPPVQKARELIAR